MAREERDRQIAVTEDGRSLPTVEILTGRGFICGKSGSGKSIREGTPVYTENGRKPIEAVAETERVLSLNKHTLEQEFRPVEAVIEHDADDLVEITLEDGTELVGTEDHSFLTIDEREIVPIRGSEVTEGTWFPLARELPSTESVAEIDLAEYVSEGPNLSVGETTIRSGPRTDERRLPLTLETGKVIGLYLAEGSFDSHDTLQISNDADGVREFLDEQGFNVYARTCNKGFKPLATFLQSEFGVGADGKSLPNWVYDTPAPFRTGVVSGYFDGDGTIDDDTASAMSKSLELLEGMKELLRQFGISATLREKLVVYNDDRRRYERLTVDAFSMEAFADVVELSVEEKAAALRSVTTDSEGEAYNSKDMIPGFGPVLNLAAREQGWTLRESDNRVRGASVHNLTRRQKAGRETFNRLVDALDIEGRTKALGESDIQWKRVVDVTPLSGEETVYDLDVAVNDNFVANGVFVHNSNTASVIAEGLLADGYNLLIVDTEGEYYGLKERFEVLHAGGDEFCDVEIGPEDAKSIAEAALVENVPVILDVSGYFDAEEAERLIHDVVAHLFRREKRERKPFLVLIEEMQEYLPQSGGGTDLAKLLKRIGKRGRKRGFGICGMSQRPSSVDKDFITQCDWLVWHRLTWKNDVSIAGDVLGSERADLIQGFDAGEGFLLTDWDDSVDRVRFRRKATHDAGATPGLDSYDGTAGNGTTDALLSEDSPLETPAEPGRDDPDRRDDATAREQETVTRNADLDGAVAEIDAARDSGGERSLDRAAAGDLETAVEPTQRRNRALESEVAERRAGHDDLASAGDLGTGHADGNAGSQTSGVIDIPNSIVSSPRRRPTPPTPPTATEDRTGVGGVVAEIGDLTVFLLRSAGYRLRLGSYLLRRRLTDDDR